MSEIDQSKILAVAGGQPTPDLQTLQIVVDMAQGRSVLLVDAAALVSLGSLCLHVATNEPIGPTAAIPVTSIQHQSQPNGFQTLRFEVPGGLRFFLALEPKGAAALRDMLLTAIGPPRDAGPPPLQTN